MSSGIRSGWYDECIVLCKDSCVLQKGDVHERAGKGQYRILEFAASGRGSFRHRFHYGSPYGATHGVYPLDDERTAQT
ncbi:hypothetical protein D3C74_392170 [compost metagenome]